MRKPGGKMLSVAFLLLAGAATAVVALYTRPPVPDAKLRQLKPGISDEAVRQLLGPPTCIYSATNLPGWNVPGTNNRAAQWTYERHLPFSHTRVDVFFTNGAVSFTGGDWDPW